MLFSTNIKCKVKNIFYIKVVYIYFLYLFMKDIIRQLLNFCISPTNVGWGNVGKVICIFMHSFFLLPFCFYSC